MSEEIVEFTLTVPAKKGLLANAVKKWHGAYNIKFYIDEDKNRVDLAISGVPIDQVKAMGQTILQRLAKDYIEGKATPVSRYCAPLYKFASFTPTSKCGSDADSISESLDDIMGKLGAVREVGLGDTDLELMPIDDKPTKAEAPKKPFTDIVKPKAHVRPAASTQEVELPLKDIEKNVRRKVKKWFYLEEGAKPDPRYSEKTYNDMVEFGCEMVGKYLRNRITLADLGTAMIEHASAEQGGLFPNRSKERYQRFAASMRNIADLLREEMGKPKSRPTPADTPSLRQR